MNSDTEMKAGHSAANRVGGRRVSLPDHPVPVVRKEFERKLPEDADKDKEDNEDERELERLEKFEYEKMTRMAEAERQAMSYQNQPKRQFHSNFQQKENIHVFQPILHTHTKSGGAAQSQQ
ncbi:hypothetical protein BGZ98_006757 [Dissophora globulifera]|nr:hypothetical protein BGZ98_006757 [Dissophora globulifera]